MGWHSFGVVLGPLLQVQTRIAELKSTSTLWDTMTIRLRESSDPQQRDGRPWVQKSPPSCPNQVAQQGIHDPDRPADGNGEPGVIR